MRHLFTVFCLLLSAQILSAQKEIRIENGAASYISSQNVYVKFASTEHINKGDTLYTQNADQYVPALVVKDKSSTSCVCTPLIKEKVKAGDLFFAKTMVDPKESSGKKPKEKKKTPPVTGQDSTIITPPVVIAPTPDDKDEPDAVRQVLKGRISAASYSNFNGEDALHRMRYTFTFQGNHIKKSRFSTDNYITFRHNIGEWEAVKTNFSDALKVYSLAVKYDLDKYSSISLGRKINNRISSMGAIDGLQFEKGWGRSGRFITGAILGSRPDYADYGINLNLMQAGLYIGHSGRKGAKTLESTLAFVEQRNLSHTDRRFAYFQHSNALTKDLFFFGSFEVDMYKNVNNEVSTKPSLTNLLLTLRYRVSKRLNINAAYDNRRNIIYYESYKNYIDQLIDNETRQGLRFGAGYKFTKRITGGANASWRFQKSDLNLSKNLNTYLNFSRLPWINASASLSANWLQTNYLDSKIYGIRLNKEIIKSKLNAELYFRRVEYQYKNYELKILQDIAGIDLAWNITRKLSFHTYYEGTFDQNNQPFNRFNTKLIQRF